MNKQLVLSDCICWLQNLLRRNIHPLFLDPTLEYIMLSCLWACSDVRTDTSPTENNFLIQPGEEKINGKCGSKLKSSQAGITRTAADNCSNEDSLVLHNITHPFSSSYDLPELCIGVRAEIGCCIISTREVRTWQQTWYSINNKQFWYKLFLPGHRWIVWIPNRVCALPSLQPSISFP